MAEINTVTLTLANEFVQKGFYSINFIKEDVKKETKYQFSLKT